eukprot:16427910-Heterocapsa_arctica.AAC.1
MQGPRGRPGRRRRLHLLGQCPHGHRRRGRCGITPSRPSTLTGTGDRGSNRASRTRRGRFLPDSGGAHLSRE